MIPHLTAQLKIATEAMNMRTLYYHFANWRFVQMLYAKHSFDQAARSWATSPPVTAK